MTKFKWRSMIKLVKNDFIFAKNLKMIVILILPMWFTVVIGAYSFFVYYLNEEISKNTTSTASEIKTVFDKDVVECEKMLAYISSSKEIDEWLETDAIDLNKFDTNMLMKRMRDMLVISGFTNDKVTEICIFDKSKNIIISRNYLGDINNVKDNNIILDISNKYSTYEYMTVFEGQSAYFVKNITHGGNENLMILLQLNLDEVIIDIKNSDEIDEFRIYTDKLKYAYAKNGSDNGVASDNDQLSQCFKNADDDVQKIHINGNKKIVSYISSSYNDWQYLWTKSNKIFINNMTSTNLLLIEIILFITLFGVLLAFLINLILTNELRKLQTYALQSQIGPHFLHNTLAMISLRSNVLLKGENEISKMINSLSKMMRNGMSVADGIVELSEENSCAAEYLEIMKLRYKNKFDVEWFVDEAVDTCVIPKITLQPIIENAIYHGIKPIEHHGRIVITEKVIDKNVVITIEDNGIGMSKNRLCEINNMLMEKITNTNRRIGVLNVNARIKLSFGKKYGLIFSSEENNGTKCTITIPKEFNK